MKLKGVRERLNTDSEVLGTYGYITFKRMQADIKTLLASEEAELAALKKENEELKELINELRDCEDAHG